MNCIGFSCVSLIFICRFSCLLMLINLARMIVCFVWLIRWDRVDGIFQNDGFRCTTLMVVSFSWYVCCFSCRVMCKCSSRCSCVRGEDFGSVVWVVDFIFWVLVVIILTAFVFDWLPSYQCKCFCLFVSYGYLSSILISLIDVTSCNCYWCLLC